MHTVNQRSPAKTTRREFLGAAGGVILAINRAARASQDRPAGEGGWALAAEILRRVQAPVFAPRDFSIEKYGASGNGKTDCTEAIRRAINKCASAGGGRVLVPAGVFLTGAIHLKDNVNLHLASGATLRFSRDPQQYLPAVFTRWEGTECMNYSPFIYAYGQKNIAITGTGTLDGQADCEHWWPWKGNTACGWRQGQPNQQKARDLLMQMGAQDVPVSRRVFAEGHYLRPSFIQPYRCQNVLIEGLSVTNSPMWEVHPVLCANVTVRGVKVSSHGPNNDGCDPECCRDVLIEDCHFDTGDDCIAIKSGRNRDGRRVAAPCENVVIRRCEMKDGHGGVTIGSEVSGNVRNVFAEDCRMDSPNLDRVLRIKTNAVRGGIVERVFMRNVTVGQVADAVLSIDFHYEEGANGPESPVVHEIELDRVTCKKSKYALYLRGFSSAPIRNVRLKDCTFDNVEKKDLVEYAEGLVLENVKVNGELTKP
jgi:polygalacturonase